MFQSAVNPAQMMNWYPNQQPTYSNYQPQNMVQQPVPRSQGTIGIPGRVVNSTNEIMPSDVPMDGTTSLFPLMDGSVILAKSWNMDGTIKTERYIKESPQPDIPEESPFDQIMKRLDSIEKVLNRKPNEKKGGENNG